MNNSNFIVAVLLSILILVGFHYFVDKPEQDRYRQQVALQKMAEAPKAVEKTPETLRDRAAVIAEDARVPVETPEVRGSINLRGGRLDDLSLVQYHEDTAKDSPSIILLSPAGSAAPHAAYYIESGWLGENAPLPGSATLWSTEDKRLTPDHPVKLTWDNGQGLVFERTVAVDEHYLFTITDRVTNKGEALVTLYPYGLIARHGKPHTEDTYVLHEGLLGVLNGTLTEIKYKKLFTDPRIATESHGGWLGITDKYWLVALLPPQDDTIAASFTYDPAGATAPDQGVFQTDLRGTAVSLAAGASTVKTLNVFAGAKRVRLIDTYESQLGLPLFDRAIDFGWYYYLTKPFLYLLDWLGTHLGNMGYAILVLTLLLKTLTYPLSMKSYRATARIKALQPQIAALQERYKEDKQKLSMEMFELYKREKVNPMSGCLPQLIQIPIFFALYKVLFVGIELRQAPLFGWIHDMAAPDPTSVLTLFGLIPDFGVIPHIGVWPILMGISMYVQQLLSPAPPDKSQAAVFKFLPILFTFMMAHFSSGLVFYWTISNLLGIAQQWAVMRHTRPRAQAA